MRTWVWIVGVALCTSGMTCGGPPELDLTVRFPEDASAEERERVTSLEFSLLARCSDVDVASGAAAEDPLRRWPAVVRNEAMPDFGTIQPGEHAIHVRAFEGSCQVVYAGCTDFHAKDDAKVRVVVDLEAVEAGPSCTEGLLCMDGTCHERTVDGGEIADGGSPHDGAVLSCLGEPAGTACSEGGAAGRCYDGLCCTGCFDGTTCRPAPDATACGRGGLACEACCEGEACTDGACVPADPVVQAAAGRDTTCAVTKAGALWCWGANAYDQLGLGNAPTGAATCAQTYAESGWVAGDCYPEPQAVAPPAADRTWSFVDVGYRHSCGLDDQHRLYCWGDDGSEQLGNGASAGATTAPVALGASTYRLLAVGENHSCAIEEGENEGRLLCWGRNGSGQAGVGTVTNISVPSFVVGGDGTLAGSWDSVATSTNHTCGLRLGVVYCWGYNQFGQVGPAGVVDANQLTPAAVALDGIDPTDVQVGFGTSCASDLIAGRSFCWGRNVWGTFGNGVTDGNAAPTPSEVPWGADLATLWRDAGYHGCHIDDGGALRCWGRNRWGEVGSGATGNGTTETTVTAPTQVGIPTDWVSVTTGAQHTCGIREGGRLYCWGMNNAGQLGVGDRAPFGQSAHSAPTPLRVCLGP